LQENPIKTTSLLYPDIGIRTFHHTHPTAASQRDGRARPDKFSTVTDASAWQAQRWSTCCWVSGYCFLIPFECGRCHAASL